MKRTATEPRPPHPAVGGRAPRARAARGVLPALATLLLAACGGGAELPVLFDTPDFALTDQAGDTLRASDLEGQAWVVHPFFTSCRNVCPATTRRMAGLRDSLASAGVLGDDVRLVSITVDPARDTTAALRRWAEEHGGSPPARWAFLRGEPPGDVRRLIQDGFHLSAMMPPSAGSADGAAGDTAGGKADAPAAPGAPGDAAGAAGDTAGADYQVIHASQVLLVDGRGRVRGTYEILRPEAFRQLVSDARRLARGGG